MTEKSMTTDIAALDPALAKRVGEVLEGVTPGLRKADEYEPLGHDGWEAADLITALLTQNAFLLAEINALRAEAQEMGAGIVTLSHEHSMERARANAAEAREERLREVLRELITCVEDGCFCSEMKMATAITEARAALTTETDNG